MENNVTVIGSHKEAILTTDHSRSSYGQPVLLINGIAYGPADTINGQPLLIAAGSPAKTKDVQQLFSAPLDLDTPEVSAWNRRVRDIATAGKEWSDEAGGYTAEAEGK